MTKKILIIMAVALMAGSVATAQELTPMQREIVAYSEKPIKFDLLNDPEGTIIRNGSFYDFESSQWVYCAMKRVLGVGKDYYQFWTSTGYATDGKIVGSISYDLTPAMACFFGAPIFDIISVDVGYYAGFDLKSDEIAHGVGGTILKVNVGELMHTLGMSFI